MRIGVLAKRAAVSTSKIRFYEARGLLPPAARLANRYRDYDERGLLTLLFIERAQRLGFTLADITRHLHLPQGIARKASLQSRLEAKLVEIDAHILASQERRAAVVGLIEEVRGLRDSRGQLGSGSAESSITTARPDPADHANSRRAPPSRR